MEVFKLLDAGFSRKRKKGFGGKNEEKGGSRDEDLYIKVLKFQRGLMQKVSLLGPHTTHPQLLT